MTPNDAKLQPPECKDASAFAMVGLVAAVLALALVVGLVIYSMSDHRMTADSSTSETTGRTEDTNAPRLNRPQDPWSPQ